VIPDRIAAAFSQGVRHRGQDYWRQGRVQLELLSDGHISATVRGSDTYRVTIDLYSGRKRAELDCTCPYAIDYGACKHLWATLLAADDEGVFEPVQDDTVARNLGIEGPARSHVPRVRRTIAAAKRDPAPSLWRRQLGVFTGLGASTGQFQHQPAPQWPADRRIVYLLDVDATASNDAPTIEVKTEREGPRRQGGSRFVLTEEVWRLVPDAEDRAIVDMLVGARTDSPYYQTAYERGRERHRFVLSPGAVDTILRRICATGRCRLYSKMRPDLNDAVAVVDEGDPWQFRLRIVPDEGSGGWRVEPVLSRSGEVIGLQSLAAATSGGLIVMRERVMRLATGRHHAMIVAMLLHAPVHAPKHELGDLAGALCGLPDGPPVDLPPECGVREVRADPVPVLTLKRTAAMSWVDGYEVRLAFVYDDVRVSYGKSIAGAKAARGRLPVVHRQPDREHAAMTRLLELGAVRQHHWNASAERLTVAANRAESIIRTVTEEGWHAELEGARYRNHGVPSVTISSGIDWFDLEGTVDYGGHAATLPDMLDAFRRGASTVELDDGSRGFLPVDWLRQFAGVLGMGAKAQGPALRFTRMQAALLDALLAELPEPRVDKVFQRIRRELATFDSVKPARAPRGFTGALRHYQSEGLGWMRFLQRLGLGGCLADDMGLGKTVQVLALLEQRRASGAGPSVVVVPRSLVFNWRQEAARFAPRLRVAELAGKGRAGDGLAAETFDVLLVTYGVLRRDIARFRDVEFDYAILDEAQAIKNSGTASAKAARLIRASHRLVLTGTPIENRLDDLWSLFDFLNPGLLDATKAFAPVRSGGNGEAGAPPDGTARRVMARALRPMILRRTKEQVAPELPRKTEQTLLIELEPNQRRVYDALRDRYRSDLLRRIDRDGMAKSRMHVLEALLRLRQAACHPALLGEEHRATTSAKLNALLPQLAEVVAEGHKALVFSQFTSLLALVEPELAAAGLVYEYLDGRTIDREARVKRFQEDPACMVFLISLKAGGQGLNLTAADYVFLLDPWWNPAVEAQAIDRAHRIGQRKPVMAMRLIARDTVEEKVLELQRTKRELADAILNDDKAGISRIGRAELELLLG